MIYRFATPNADFGGIRSGVQFHNGHGETASAAITDDLLALGYTLIETVAPLARLGEPPEDLLNPVVLSDAGDDIAPDPGEIVPQPAEKPKRKSR